MTAPTLGPLTNGNSSLERQLNVISRQLGIVIQLLKEGNDTDPEPYFQSVRPATRYNGVLDDGWRCKHRHRSKSAAQYCAGQELRRRG